MAASTAFNTRELIDLELRYWEVVQRHDGRAAADLTAPECLYVGDAGVNTMDPATIRSMTDSAESSFEFEIDRDSMKVVPLTDDVAVVVYRVKQTMKGEKPVTNFDSTTWVRSGGAWRAAMHTETHAAK